MTETLKSNSTPTVSSLEQVVRPEVLAFRAEIAKADGKLIALRKLTKDGKRLYIAARHILAPTKGNDQGVYKDFYAWSQGPLEAILLIDVYAQGQESDDINPVGHIDWRILQNSEANGAGNMHGSLVPRNEYEHLAEKKWRDLTAFKSDPEYQKQNIGTFILATSAVVLPAIGVKKFFPGVLLGPAKKTFGRFDIKIKDFVIKDELTPLPIEQLSRHRKVDEVISEFV